MREELAQMKEEKQLVERLAAKTLEEKHLERSELLAIIEKLRSDLKHEKNLIQKQLADQYGVERGGYQDTIRQMKLEIAQKDEISRQLLEQVKKAIRRPG